MPPPPPLHWLAPGPPPPRTRQSIHRTTASRRHPPSFNATLLEGHRLAALVDTLLSALKAVGLFESDTVQERPWGIWADWYRSDEATLKCMVIKPGARMSLQRHRERQEIWRVISGHGEDQGTNPPTKLTPGKTHVVAVGATHRIANTGTTPLVIVELQMGHCTEDDIERLQDDYNR